MTPTLNEANLFKIAVRDEKSKQKTAMTVGTKKDPKNFFFRKQFQLQCDSNQKKSIHLKADRVSRGDCLVQFWLLLDYLLDSSRMFNCCGHSLCEMLLNMD